MTEEHTGFKDPSKSNGELVLQTLFAEFLDAKYQAQKSKTDPNKLATYIDAGVALSNRSCATWFALHNAYREQTDYQQGLINLIGNVVNAGLSFSDSNVNLMGYTSLLLGGINSGYELFKEDHFLSGTIWKLEKGIREGRIASAQNLKANMEGDNPYTYFQVQDAMLDYHNTCSRLRIIGYIEESIELARYQPASTEYSIESAELQEINKDLFRIARGSQGLFSEKRLRELYVVFRAGSTDWATELKKDSYIADVVSTIDKLRTKEEGETDEKVAQDSETASRFVDLLDRAGVILKMDEAIRQRLEQIEQKQAEEERARKQAEDEAGDVDIVNEDGSPNETLIYPNGFGEGQEEAREAFKDWLEAYRNLESARELPKGASSEARLPIVLETVPRSQQGRDNQ